MRNALLSFTLNSKLFRTISSCGVLRLASCVLGNSTKDTPKKNPREASPPRCTTCFLSRRRQHCDENEGLDRSCCHPCTVEGCDQRTGTTNPFTHTTCFQTPTARCDEQSSRTNKPGQLQHQYVCNTSCQTSSACWYYLVPVHPSAGPFHLVLTCLFDTLPCRRRAAAS